MRSCGGLYGGYRNLPEVGAERPVSDSDYEITVSANELHSSPELQRQEPIRVKDQNLAPELVDCDREQQQNDQEEQQGEEEIVFHPLQEAELNAFVQRQYEFEIFQNVSGVSEAVKN